MVHQAARLAKDADVIVFIGRFNPFHLGHAYVLKRALDTAKLVIVLVGSSGLSRSLRNPFTFEERKQMIEEWEAGQEHNGHLMIIAARDFPYNDTLWQRNVQRLVKDVIKMSPLAGTNPKIMITGSDRDSSTWYLKSFPQWEQALSEPYLNGSVNVSATDVRRWLLDDSLMEELAYVQNSLPESTLNFIDRFVETKEYDALVDTYFYVKNYKEAAAKAPYPPTYVTVDAVTIQSGHILTVIRGNNPGKGLWALPGGFVNQTERLRAASIRELIEETRIKLAEGKRWREITEDILRGSNRSMGVFDAPNRSDRGRTITHAFYYRLDDTKPLPSVGGSTQGNMDPECDTAAAFWLPIDEALERSDMWFEDHHAIIETMIANQDIKASS